MSGEHPLLLMRLHNPDQREAERKVGEASGVESEPRPAGDSSKPHGDKFPNTFSQETPDEPVVEDEP